MSKVVENFFLVVILPSSRGKNVDVHALVLREFFYQVHRIDTYSSYRRKEFRGKECQSYRNLFLISALPIINPSLRDLSLGGVALRL